MIVDAGGELASLRLAEVRIELLAKVGVDQSPSRLRSERAIPGQ
jgi:hypothetical protein